MKKPQVLSLKEKVKEKRIKSVSTDFKERKKQYQNLKNLRQKIKDKKQLHQTKVIHHLIFRLKTTERRQ